MKAGDLFAVLQRAPLRYEVTRTSGSHRRMESAGGYPPLTFAFHATQTLPPGLVRKVLVKDVGLTVDEARALL
ncbi:MAG: type II toxin-antitoxin system HicA family toxin [Actinomycetota bacterium]|nr:type II toxin-antitoxin system HicA family toxin [Actinomycetota bacterium]